MSEAQPDKKRVTPFNLFVAVVTIAIVQLFGLGVTRQTIVPYQQIVNSTGPAGPAGPAGTTPAGSIFNAVFLVGFAFAATLVLVWVLRRKMVRSFKTLIFGSVAFSAFFLNLITVDSVAYQYLPPSLELPLVFGSSFLLVALVAYVVFVKNVLWLSTVILALIGAEVGSFFALTLPLYTAILLPIAFSAYDIYAVFRGPLKQLISIDSNVALAGMSIKAGEFTLGLGDVVFYTMLPSIALAYLPISAPFATIIAIDAGVAVTLFLLSKKRLLPGLPIPMLLGMLVLGFYFLI
ncbi:MAG TPA: hypothetical protein VFE91_03415 [Nitrososphaerales archaeon]|nr:hypothetical protein [Nitrososphaerales archaeon]